MDSVGEREDEGGVWLWMWVGVERGRAPALGRGVMALSMWAGIMVRAAVVLDGEGLKPSRLAAVYCVPSVPVPGVPAEFVVSEL